ncbi:hypothetical protein Pla175_20480 [Pirellulimonas nuda]|uniref:Uncharacterized protein n=1 Tax=Pirellulimonas nuda TaxID=2528009 RepID=A0A518DB29_9BACT|nr:helix-turn-helix domain-containing protein [Pirellulimonas nuda]QDU88668.1 hypothetical protein Pla175_20480 [Pirellulimonas nuda]
MDEAVELLGVSRERMNELRESNEVRGYRDGASWKFRGEDIDRLVEQGVPSPEDSGLSDATINMGAPSPSTLGSIGGKGSPIEDLDDLRLEDDGPANAEGSDAFELDLSDDALSDSTAVPHAKAPAPGDPPASDLGLEIDPLDDDADSILLSEAELGDDSGGRPPSTIIGRTDSQDESDLKLASSQDSDLASMSDVKLAASVEDVLSGDGPAAGKSGFDQLEEIDIDLELESSKIIPSSDADAARTAARQATQKAPSMPTGDTGSGLELELEEAEGSSAPLDESSADDDFGLGDSGSSVVLSEDEDDDFVLGGGGSQVGISGGDSGINLSPSDSGIALDEVPLEMSGAAAGSSFDLGSSLDIDTGASALGSGAPVAGEDFLLTPLGEAGEDEDSSQVIALDEVEEGSPEISGFGSLSGSGFSSTGLSGAGLSGAGLSGAGLSGAGLSGAGLSGAGLGSGLGGDEALGGAMPPSSIAMPTVPEARFDVFSLSLLAVCLVPMTLGAMVMTDLIRTMWSYEEPTVIGSSLIDGLRSLFGGG